MGTFADVQMQDTSFQCKINFFTLRCSKVPKNDATAVSTAAVDTNMIDRTTRREERVKCRRCVVVFDNRREILFHHSSN